MSGTRNWNDMSSSGSEDSWFDDDEVPEAKKPEAPQAAKHEDAQSTTKTEPTQPESIKKPTQVKQRPPQKQGAERKQNYLKDEDLIVEYSNKRVDDPRVIKAVKCFNEQHKTLLKSLKNARVKEVKDGIFILNFNQPEDLLQFIREKIANRYRFFLQPFFKRKVENQEERHGEEKKEHHEEKRRERKPRYQEDRDDEDKKAKRYEDRKERQGKRVEKEEEKAKKNYVAKETFELESNKNNLLIKSQSFEIQRVLQELIDKKVFKNFNKLKIKTPFGYLAKVSKLVNEISSKFKFNLEKEPPQDLKKEDEVELTLIQNLNVKTTKVLVEKHHQKAEPTQKVPKETKQHKEQAVKVEGPANVRKLASNFEEYFANIPKSNVSEIVKGFDENEYVKRLKQNTTVIFEKSWNSWKIEGQEQQIEPLLKLVHRLKKSTIYDVDLKPSVRNEKSILTAQLKPRPQKQRRPKVDVSGVNGYLS